MSKECETRNTEERQYHEKCSRHTSKYILLTPKLPIKHMTPQNLKSPAISLIKCNNGERPIDYEHHKRMIEKV